MQKWFTDVLRFKYVDFSGRAARQEYWMFYLWCFLLTILVSLINNWEISLVVAVGLFIPTLAISFRRLHDSDKSGWWMLILFIPLLGLLIFLVFLVSKGTSGPNRFGADPLVKAPPAPPAPPAAPVQV